MNDFKEQLQNIKNQENSYQKQHKTFHEQLEILKQRKLTIPNDSYALSKLQHINYYRLSAYFLPFTHPKDGDKKDIFLQGSTFEDIVQLYYFDTELRKIIFEAIESIEIYFRTQITYFHTQKYDSLGYLKKENFEVSQEFFNDVIQNLKSETKRSKEIFIKHFKSKYKTTDLPLWVVVEVISFGTLSKIYSMLKTDEQKEVISQLKGINNKVFKNWLHSLSVVRNICAHHSRLWNKTLGVKFGVPRKLNEFKDIKSDKLFFVLSTIEYILTSIGEDEIDFKSKIKALIAKYPKVNLESMGYTQNWEQNPIWRDDE